MTGCFGSGPANHFGGNMWTVVYTAQDRQMSDNLCDALRGKNILVKIIGAASENKFDILVPSTEVEQAHDVLIDMTF